MSQKLTAIAIAAMTSGATAAQADDADKSMFSFSSLGTLPVDHSERAALRDAFYTKVTSKSPAQIKAYWSKIVFTGKGQPPRKCLIARPLGSWLPTIPMRLVTLIKAPSMAVSKRYSRIDAASGALRRREVRKCL